MEFSALRLSSCNRYYLLNYVKPFFYPPAPFSLRLLIHTDSVGKATEKHSQFRLTSEDGASLLGEAERASEEISSLVRSSVVYPGLVAPERE